MEIKVIEKFKNITFSDLKVGDYFILIEDNDFMVKMDIGRICNSLTNVYSIKEDVFYYLSGGNKVKNVNIKEIIVKEI